ncbi:pyrroline-5-carboxylate reductase [Pseudomonas fluorescens]|uniref:pyrroline-5-carboxylate reductase n=1 Tax=Pseudomonas fluorescens TaxID=294 RepID=UPI000364A486|nr:pyrroline-5-carboxylate reductase [Pseudomonas fluorescens]
MKAIDIIIIGAGHMGYAIAMGLTKSSSTLSIAAIDLEHTYEKELKAAGIQVMNTLPQHATSKTMILAIPPQSFATLLESNAQIKQHADIIISVMAGINLAELTDRLKTSQVCRSIPNLPCAVNQGMCVLMYAPHATQKNRRLVNELFSKLGSLLIVQEESLIDDATALVGGGPAYVSYFAQALIEYALLAGFDKADAGAMVVKLLRGSLALLDTFQESPTQLCEKVMTPNGTTEQAIRYFKSQQMQAIIIDGLKRSCARSRELGRRT